MKKLIFIIALLLAGCSSDPVEEAVIQERRNTINAKDNLEKMAYVKDARTNLCFASGWDGAANGGPFLANVPCDAVKDYIK